MSNLALTSLRYNQLKKRINTLHGKNSVILVDDILQDSLLKMIESGHQLSKTDYILNTAKYVTWNAVKTFVSRKKKETDIWYYLIISTHTIGWSPEELLSFKQQTKEHTEQIKDTINLSDVSNRSVLCTTTGEVFETSLDASKAYGISPSMISKHLSGNKKSAGKYKNTPLQWKRLTIDEK